MKPVDYIALAIPVFFALIAVEVVVARLRGERLYRLNDSLSDLATGVLQQLTQVFTKAALVGVYAWIWHNHRLFELSISSPWTWIGCFLGVDFLYYWFHRVSHESNLPWGAHIVHHSSEEYNLTVALRQGSFQPFFSFLFDLPLAWLGFPPIVFLACSSWDTLYQFWIHTRAIKKLGPLEWVLNTPSHHRVHHGCDDKYLDRNYAGTLIIWDRMFGSFQAEEEEPTYGITKPLQSWNPVWANVHHYVDTASRAKAAPNPLEWLKVWIKPPGWNPPWADATWSAPAPRPNPLTDGEAGKYNARPPGPLVALLLVHFVSAVAATMFLLHRADTLEPFERWAIGVFVVWTLATVGALFDRRGWGIWAELGRLGALWIGAVALVSNRNVTWLPTLVVALTVFTAASAAILLQQVKKTAVQVKIAS